MCNTQVITYKKNMCRRRADVRSAPGLCVHQVLRLFLYGTYTMPAQHCLPQQYTLHIPSPYIHTHSRLYLCNILSLYTYTHRHTQTSIHTHMCMPMYNIHSFTYRQCTTMLAYTYTYRAAAYLTHLCTAAHTCSHTVCVIHLHRDTHSHTKVNIIVLYTQICTRGASAIGTLCRGTRTVQVVRTVQHVLQLCTNDRRKKKKKKLDKYTLLCYTKYIRKR